MANSLVYDVADVPEHLVVETRAEAGHPAEHMKVIVGLTPTVKGLIGTFVVIPWLANTCFLLWLGCRWLTATNDFGNLISNAVALEFVLYLKDLIYLALVSERNKREMRGTELIPTVKKESGTAVLYLGAFFWGLITIAWIYLYIYYLQAVLPEYRWDVKDVCAGWFNSLLEDAPSSLQEGAGNAPDAPALASLNASLSAANGSAKMILTQLWVRR